MNEDEFYQLIQRAKEGKLSGDEMKAISKIAKTNPELLNTQNNFGFN